MRIYVYIYRMFFVLVAMIFEIFLIEETRVDCHSFCLAIFREKWI